MANTARGVPRRPHDVVAQQVLVDDGVDRPRVADRRLPPIAKPVCSRTQRASAITAPSAPRPRGSRRSR